MAEGTGNIIEVFKAIPPGKRISFFITFALVVGGFIALLMYTNQPDYQILFSNLDTSDAAKITEKLREERVKYDLKDHGSSIYVPSEQVYQLRLDLATEGLPKSSGVGFEIFDNTSFGTTEFVLKLRYRQALQGELARTIKEFDSISQAKVHIVPAGDSLFAEEDKPAAASVAIRLNKGRKLNQRHLQGITNLVAASVEGLKPENVSIVDMEGGMLSNGYDEDILGSAGSTQFDQKRRLAEGYEKDILGLLEPVIGINKVRAKVTVEVDFDSENISEEKYDPDSAVVYREERTKETTSEGNRLPSGSPDTGEDSASMNVTASELANKTEKEESSLNYLINKINRQAFDSPGDIIRLSAAVLIDGPYEQGTDEQGNTTQVFKPRDKKEMSNFEDIVRKAIGYDEQRGDQVIVRNVAFSMEKPDFSDMAAEAPEGWMGYVKKGSKPFLNVILIALFFIIAIKPFRKWLSQTSEYVSANVQVQQAALEEPRDTPELQLKQNNKIRLLEATRENPDMAADIIRTWLNEVS